MTICHPFHTLTYLGIEIVIDKGILTEEADKIR
jgi:hypothetical protein